MNDTITIEQMERLLQELNDQTTVVRNFIIAAKYDKMHPNEAAKKFKQIVEKIKKALP